MAKLVKTDVNLPGIHDLKTQGNIPHPTVSPFVRLHQLQKNKERFLKEKNRILRRLDQIHRQVPAIEDELERLFTITEEEVRPSVAGRTPKTAKAAKEKIVPKAPKGTVLEY